MDEEHSKHRKLTIEKYSSFDELYSTLTKEGSLGLLALGAKGLLLWRKKRAEIEKIEKENKSE